MTDIDQALAGLQIPLVDALETQRAIRRIHPDPVPDDLLRRLIELAQKAPSGGNEQRYAFVIVTDPAVRRRIAKLNRQAWPALKLHYRKRVRGDARFARLLAAVKWQTDHFEEIPVVIVACTTWPLPGPRLAVSGAYGSVFPAVQNLLLAARGMGLGAALITLPLWSTIRARRALGLSRKVTPVAVIPIGWPRGRYGPTTRLPVGEIVHFNRWGNQPWKDAQPTSR